MHSPMHVHMLITGVVLTVSNHRMLKYPESHLLCFGYRTLFKQSLGPGTAAPEKKKQLFVLLTMGKDIVPPELATKQDALLQGSVCSSPQRLKDFHLVWVNSENASRNSSISLHKLCPS